MIMKPQDIRVLVIGAHPDDPDLLAGGVARKFVKIGATVRMISLTNGDKGHQTMTPPELAKRRYGETLRSARHLGINSYLVMDTPDCELEASLEQRKNVTRLIRQFAPHIVLTHRNCDYHADHRAAGTLVMDSAYLLGVPNWCPDTPIPPVMPAIFLQRDDFMDTWPLRPDVLVPVDDELDTLLTALTEHTSQFFEWLPFDMHTESEVPPADDLEGRKRFIEKYWVGHRKCGDADRFRAKLVKALGPAGEKVRYVEPFELSQYGKQISVEEMRELFPFLEPGLVG